MPLLHTECCKDIPLPIKEYLTSTSASVELWPEIKNKVFGDRYLRNLTLFPLLGKCLLSFLLEGIILYNKTFTHTHKYDAGHTHGIHRPKLTLLHHRNAFHIGL